MTFPSDKLEQAFRDMMQATYKSVKPGTNQYSDLRDAFFGGALSMLRSTEEASVHPDEDLCVARMELLNRELMRFKDEVSQRAKGLGGAN